MKTHQGIPFTKAFKTVAFVLFFALNSAGSFGQSCSMNQEKASDDQNLETQLWEANTSEVISIINENPSLIDKRLRNDETLLTIAAWTENKDLVEFLLSKGANPDLQNDWDNTALHNAAQKGNVEIAELLLQHGGSINMKGTVGNTALYFAIDKNHPELACLLMKKGADINICNNYGIYPIRVASWRPNPEILSMLIDRGADIGFSDEGGWTILHNLASNGDVASLKLVLSKNADANKVNIEGRLPLHIALINNHTEAAAVLLKYTTNINQPETALGNTPLHIAAINGDKVSTEKLFNAGADASIKNNSGKSACDYAVKYGYSGIVKYYADKKLVSKEMVKRAEENKENALVTLKGKEAKITYCGHSGWAVQTTSHFLIFDYWSHGQKGNQGLSNGSICPEELKDKNVIVFVSHDHTDHYDTTIYQWAGKIKNIQYVYGFEAEKSWIHQNKAYQGPAYTYISDNQQKIINGVKVTTFPSTDSGQGFLVEADGVTIYHPGDHAYFAEIDEVPFKKEVDYIASLSTDIDIAFLPVSGCPSRWKKEFIADGFIYTLDKLHPAYIYPMHSFRREYLMKEFTLLAGDRKDQEQVICSENSGDSFLFNKTVVASK